VSTDEQNIVQQKDLLRRSCAERGYDLVLTASDKAVSGSERDRVGWNRVLYHGRRGDYSVLVVQDLDRICRNWEMGVEVEKFILETGIRLESLGEPVDFSSATGRLMFRVKMCVAAHQRESTIERIKVGTERAKREGKYHGRRKGAVNRPKRGRPRKRR
jgi:DNA invertase Pin-like site-specific DNA recombinase